MKHQSISQSLRQHAISLELENYEEVIFAKPSEIDPVLTKLSINKLGKYNDLVSKQFKSFDSASGEMRFKSLLEIVNEFQNLSEIKYIAEKLISTYLEYSSLVSKLETTIDSLHFSEADKVMTKQYIRDCGYSEAITYLNEPF